MPALNYPPSPPTPPGGVCLSDVQHGLLSSLSVQGNGVSVSASLARNLTFRDIQCDRVLYKGKAWVVDCEGCSVSNVSCAPGVEARTSEHAGGWVSARCVCW